MDSKSGIKVGNPFKTLLKDFLLAVNWGILGFLLYLLAIITVKFIRVIITGESVTYIEPEDIYLSALGFLLFFIIKVLKKKIK